MDRSHPAYTQCEAQRCPTMRAGMWSREASSPPVLIVGMSMGAAVVIALASVLVCRLRTYLGLTSFLSWRPVCEQKGCCKVAGTVVGHSFKTENKRRRRSGLNHYYLYLN